jgi:threonine dehydratase
MVGRMARTLAPTLVRLDEVQAARERIAGFLRRTPTDPADTISRLAGRVVLLKPEHLQRTGSFKIRGAANFMAGLPPGGEVVAGSAGNHAQGVALAATLTGRRATLFMPRGAPLPKRMASREYGAHVELVEDAVDECMVQAAIYAEQRGAVLVPPFDDPAVIAGQGTIGLEILEEAPDIEAIVVPVGGGGLLSGIATAARGLRPDLRVFGVQPEGAAAMARSLEAGRPVSVEEPRTMADGVALKRPSALTVAHAAALVEGVVTVTEEEISRAMLILLERAKAVVEPAGALAVAALLAGRIPGSGPAVAVVSGGNVDPMLLTKLIEHGLSAAGRYLVLRVVLDDRPGALHRLTGALAEMDLNVLAVEHHRSGVELPLDAVEVIVTLETRDPEHRLEVADTLRAMGHRVEQLG